MHCHPERSRGKTVLHRHHRLYMRMWIIPFQHKILKPKPKNIFHLRVNFHHRQFSAFAAELEFGLLDVVAVKVCIAEGVYKLAGLQAAYLGHHHIEQGVGGNVKRYAEENIGAALVELATEFSVGHVELEKGVAGREFHVFDFAHVPGAYNEAARIGVAADLVYYLRDLVDVAAVGSGPRAPLRAVNRAQIAVLVGPFVPDAYAVFLEVGNIGIAAQEPEQFVNNGTQVQLFGGYQRKPFLQVETHLIAKNADGSRAGTVCFYSAVVENVLHKLVILLHSWADW
jgi:hypothetical protein